MRNGRSVAHQSARTLVESQSGPVTLMYLLANSLTVTENVAISEASMYANVVKTELCLYVCDWPWWVINCYLM